MTFLGWLNDPFNRLSDLQRYKKVTLNHLVNVIDVYHKTLEPTYIHILYIPAKVGDVSSKLECCFMFSSKKVVVSKLEYLSTRRIFLRFINEQQQQKRSDTFHCTYWFFN